MQGAQSLTLMNCDMPPFSIPNLWDLCLSTPQPGQPRWCVTPLAGHFSGEDWCQPQFEVSLPRDWCFCYCCAMPELFDPTWQCGVGVTHLMERGLQEQGNLEAAAVGSALT